MAEWIARSRADVALLSAVRTLDDAEAIRRRLEDLDSRRTWSMHYGKAESEGQVILSTYAMPPDERRHLVVSTADCGGTAAQIIVESTIHLAAQRIRLFAVDHEHTSEDVRACQARTFRAWSTRFDGIRIVAGDFNSTPGSTSLGMWLAHESGPGPAYHDAWAETPASARRGYGKEHARFGNSAADQRFGRTRRHRIDYILYSADDRAIRPVSAAVLDTRTPGTSCRDVKEDGFLGTGQSGQSGCGSGCVCTFVDDNGVRPSDHIPLMVTFTIRGARPATPAEDRRAPVLRF